MTAPRRRCRLPIPSGCSRRPGCNTALRLYRPDPALRLLSSALWGLTFAALPVAMGIAILKYRLWAIDRLISRTLVYSVLWLTIALAYVGLAVALGLAA